MSASGGDPPTTGKSSSAPPPEDGADARQPLSGWPIRPRPGAGSVPTMSAGAAGAPGSPPPRPSRPRSPKIAIASDKGSPLDPDASVEIPPPERIEPEQRAPGAKDPYI